MMKTKQFLGGAVALLLAVSLLCSGLVLQAGASTEADAVIAQIDAIGTVTYKSTAAIRAARTAYDGLDAAQQAEVTNYAVLTAAETEIQAIADAFDVTVTGWDNATVDSLNRPKYTRTTWMRGDVITEDAKQASREAMADEMKYEYIERGYQLGITTGEKAIDTSWNDAAAIGFGSTDEPNDNLGNPWWSSGDRRHWAYVSTCFPGISFSETGYFACGWTQGVPLSNSFEYEGKVYQMFTGGLKSHDAVEPQKMEDTSGKAAASLTNNSNLRAGGKSGDVTNNTFMYAYARFNQDHKWENRTVGIPVSESDPVDAANVLYKEFVGPNGTAYIAGSKTYIQSDAAVALAASGYPVGAYVIAGDFAEILQSLGDTMTLRLKATGAPESDEYVTEDGALRQDFEKGYMLVSDEFTGFVADAYYLIQAETAAERSGIDINSSVSALNHIENGDYALFRNLDFGTVGAASFNLYYALGSTGEEGVCQVYLDSLDGQVIATANITRTADWNTFQDLTVDCARVTGIHDVYLVFSSDAENSICDLDRINFVESDRPAYAIDAAVTSHSAVASDPAYDLTWNFALTDTFGDQFVTFNETYTVEDAGMIITATSADMNTYGQTLAEDEDVAASVSGKAYKESFGTTAYSHFSYRRTGVSAGCNRTVAFYITYSDGNDRVTVLSPADSLTALED